MHTLSFMIDILLVVYILYETLRFIPRYRQVKQAIAAGDLQARIRLYYQALFFEWVSALLALLALGFDPQKLNPKFLALSNSSWLRALLANREFLRGLIPGVVVGVVIGMAAFIVARIKSNRRVGILAAEKPVLWRRLLPDFTALLPTTVRERYLWAAVALSAGICEELVFRGWLLTTLQNSIGLGATASFIAAAMIFGMAHAYQGATGVLLTTFAGAFFCLLYVGTGSLVIPIVLHVLIDVRFAFLPAPRSTPLPVYA
jgi:membrane protease YdiL (CAAX protease family)